MGACLCLKAGELGRDSCSGSEMTGQGGAALN